MPKRCLCLFVCPLKCDRIPWKLCCPSKAFTIFHIIKRKHKSVRWEIVRLDLLCKICDLLLHRCRCYIDVFHNLKTKRHQEIKLRIHRCIDFRISGIKHIKRKEMHIPLGCNLVIELPHTAGTKISWVFIFAVNIWNRCVDTLKICIGNDSLATDRKRTFVRDLVRQIRKYLRVVRDDLTDLAISTCDCLYEHTILVSQYHCQTIHLPRHDSGFIPKPRCQILNALCLIE